MSFRPISSSESSLPYKENDPSSLNNFFETPLIKGLEISKINQIAKLSLQFLSTECLNHFVSYVGVDLKRMSIYPAKIDKLTLSFDLITDLDRSPEVFGVLVRECPELEIPLENEFEKEFKK